MLLRGMYIALYYHHLDFVWSTWFWRPGWILLLFKSSWKISQYLFNVKQVTFLNLLLLPPFKNVDFCCWNWNLGNWCGPLMTGGTSAKECGREPRSPLQHLPRAVPPPTKNSFSFSSYLPSDPVHCYGLSPRGDLAPHPLHSQKTACKESGWGTEGGKEITDRIKTAMAGNPKHKYLW